MTPKSEVPKLKKPVHPWRTGVPLSPKTLPPKIPNWSDRIIKR